MPRRGRWLFVPLPKWESLPASYYSFRKSQIYLKLWLRKVPADLMDVCLERDVLPPPNLRGRKLLNWIRSLKVTHQVKPRRRAASRADCR